MFCFWCFQLMLLTCTDMWVSYDIMHFLSLSPGFLCLVGFDFSFIGLSIHIIYFLFPFPIPILFGRLGKNFLFLHFFFFFFFSGWDAGWRTYGSRLRT